MMDTLPTPPADGAGSAVSPVVAAALTGRRRRPSGEPPALPRHIDRRSRVYIVLLVATAALWCGLTVRPVFAAVTAGDDAVLRAIAHLRWAPVTTLMDGIARAGSSLWTIRVVALVTVVVLLVARRLRHLAAFVTVLLTVAFVDAVVALWLGRMRPTGVRILDGWDGYAQPSRPVVLLAAVLAGALYTLVPAGRWRDRGKRAAVAVLALLCLARLSLAVDHPTDVAAALVLGWALSVVFYRLSAPDEVFPVTYNGAARAHLKIEGARELAITRALEQQLGLHAGAVEPFALEGSAGSTPLRLRTRTAEGERLVLFGKLYAETHLRSDRWYKFARAVLYGRLEDEKPFSTVRRLVEYEDHLLRLLRDAGLPTPHPYGFVEITPEREYLIVMEFIPHARELTGTDVTDAEIDEALAVVRMLWDAGVAHRDIKPSNLLVRDGHVLLIDVAFATVRPTPWRQAVDLANMMLTLALCSTPQRVYERAQRLFAPEDIAEAFAASRSITIPTQLRNRMRQDGRDLLGEFRRLAPPRRRVSVQSWTVRRVTVTTGVVAAALLVVVLLRSYVQLAGLI